MQAVCGQVLRWRPRADAVMGAPHEHRCQLAPGHLASGPGYVPIHECGSCTLCWESDPRPHVHCTCQAGFNPACPTHGTD